VSKALRMRANEISEEIDLSNSHMTSGSSANISTPLKRCMPETIAASGQRYDGKRWRASPAWA